MCLSVCNLIFFFLDLTPNEAMDDDISVLCNYMLRMVTTMRFIRAS